MSKLCKIGVLLFFVLLNTAQAAIPTSVVLEETGDVLTLRGQAEHRQYFQNNYLAVFYSHNILKNPKEALGDTGSKRMGLIFLLPVNDLARQWREAINQNNSPESVQRNQLSISQFLKIIAVPYQSGDTLMLDFIPNIGTKIIVKGSVRGIIKGNDFYLLILKTWMGRQPPSEKFKKALFNLS